MPDSTWISSPGDEKNDPIRQWIKNNRKSLLATLLIIVVFGLIAIMVIASRSRNRDTAEKYLFMAQQYYYAKNYEKAIENIDFIEKNYSDYSTYDFALFLKGDIYYSQENYTKAIEIYSDAEKKIKNKDLLPFVEYSVAKSYQALGDYTNAILRFNHFIETYPDHYLTPDVYLSLALSYEKKNEKEAAKETYQKITVLFPNTSWHEIAKKALEQYSSKKK